MRMIFIWWALGIAAAAVVLFYVWNMIKTNPTVKNTEDKVEAFLGFGVDE